MPTWLSVLLEIIKVTVPGVIVFLTAYYVLKTFLDKQYQLEALQLKRDQVKNSLPIKLQAYERLSLFCERINIPNLLLRIRPEGKTAAELRLTLLLAIQQEYEHNITQQVYISSQLWEIVKMARDEAVNTITLVGEKVDTKMDGRVLAEALLQFVGSREALAVDTALLAIKKEAALVL